MLLLHLLVVENHENALAGLQELLCYEGYRVRGVSTGQKAIEILAQQPVDVVLCDHTLPDINGIKLCCQLKRLHPELTFFLLTACDKWEIARVANQCAIEAVFRKPIVLDELFETLAIENANRESRFVGV